MEEVIGTAGLCKRFGRNEAVRSVDITVRRGEVYGFLGKNGAGKSTTIRMLMGLTRPSAGSVRLFGRAIRPGEYRHLDRIGSIIETPGFYPNLSARENLQVQRRLMGVADHKAIDRALERLGIQDDGKLLRHYSTGMRQRLAIARALLGDPELLILDEPVNALDPQGIKEVRLLLSSLAHEYGVTVFVSSHILAEVEKLADRIGVIHLGSLVRELDMAQVAVANRQYLLLKVTDAAKASYLLERNLGISDYRVTEPGVLRVYEKLDQAEAMGRELFASGVGVSEMKMQNDSLEDYFLKLTGGQS